MSFLAGGECKTRLLSHWLRTNHGVFAQAIEGAPEIQLDQVMRDFQAGSAVLSTSIEPKNWSEFFEMIHLAKLTGPVCIDEFPYLVESDPTLPSVIQRFIDHKMPKGIWTLRAFACFRPRGPRLCGIRLCTKRTETPSAARLEYRVIAAI